MKKTIIKSTPIYETQKAYSEMGKIMDLLLNVAKDIPQELCDISNSHVGKIKENDAIGKRVA